MKKALIVASGLKGVIGHNYFYTQVVKEELEKRGFEVVVFANKHAPAEFVEKTGFKPVFSMGAYDFVPLNGALPDSIYSYLQSRIYAYDLQAAMRAAGGDVFDLVLCHTVAEFELIAWNHYLRKHKLKACLFVMQRITPRFSTVERWKKLVHPYWRIRPHYLNALHRKLKNRFILLTDSDALTKDFAQIYPHKIITAPIPIKGFAPRAEPFDFSPDSIFSRYNLQKNGRLHFGFMGDSRNQKGFPLLAPVVEKVLERNKEKINFTIHCPVGEYENARVPPGLNELRALAELHPDNITLVAERLSDEDYLNLYQFLDAVMIPYTEPFFTEGTSNVFTEAAALGTPVIVSDNTWMSGELKKYGGGLEFKKGDVDDFAAKVIELAESYHLYVAKARAYSPVWRGFHNAENLVDVLLRESRIEKISERVNQKNLLITQ